MTKHNKFKIFKLTTVSLLITSFLPLYLTDNIKDVKQQRVYRKENNIEIKNTIKKEDDALKQSTAVIGEKV